MYGYHSTSEQKGLKGHVGPEISHRGPRRKIPPVGLNACFNALRSLLTLGPSQS